MRIKDFKIYNVRIPLLMRIKHAQAECSRTNNLVVELALESPGNSVGYGECIPRRHVTGETVNSTIKKINEILDFISDKEFNNYQDIVRNLDCMRIKHTVGRCAVELALFDSVGKATKSYIGAFIGKRRKNSIRYCGIIPYLNPKETEKFAYRLKGFKDIKVKVGFDDDLDRIRIVREVLGNKVNILLDANEAWTSGEAERKINSMKEFGIGAVEQPLGKHDYLGYRKLRKHISVRLIADESLCSVEDARELVKSRLFDIFDIRISKCGGIINAIRIAELANRNNISAYLGCHVGETGILSAAGRALAFHFGKFRYHEGSYGKYLLKEDIIKEDTTFGRGGIAYPIKGYGLGVAVDKRLLGKYS